MSAARLLFLAANPSSTSRLALDEEMHAIEQRLRLSGAADRFALRAEWALRAEQLTAALLRHKPRIVHFSSHGSASGELFLLGATAAEVVPVAADTLRRLFKTLSRDILCVVLNACFSEIQASALAEVVPCAIGMSRAVKDAAAIAFAAGFYEALAFGQSLQAAFELGCTATELAQHSDQRDVPQMRSRTGGVYQYFATGMGRLQRENHLLQSIAAAEVLARLREHDPSAVVRHESALHFE